MAIGLAVTLMIASFLIYLVLRSYFWIAADLYLFIIFIFAFVVSNREFSAFYILLFVIAMVIDLAVHKFSIEPAQGAFGVKGLSFILFQLVAGVVIYVAISLISTSQGGNIVGAPQLGISSTSTMAQNMRPTFVSHLGIIENRIAFVIFEVLALTFVAVPFLGLLSSMIPLVLPTVVTGLIMGIFHVAAYSVAFGLLIWASLAFMLFVVSYVLTKDSLAADMAHFLNNGVIDVNRGLSIVV